MTFAQPWLAAAAVACAALPFLLHLLLRRPRPTEWPSTMLLRRAVERIRRRRRLERWLLLALRSLAILLAGLAMAGPLASAGSWGSRERWIVVDDGATGAERLPDGRTAIEWMRESVRESIQELREGDRVALVSAAQPARVMLAPTLDLQRALREADAMQVHAVPASWKDAVELALPPDSTGTAVGRELVLVGSFRKGSVDAEQPLPAGWKERATGLRRWCLRMPQPGSPNRSLDEVRVARSTTEAAGSGSMPVRVDMRRSGRGSTTETVTVKSIQGEPIGRTDAAWSTDATEMRMEIQVSPSQDDALVVQATPDAQPLDDTVALASVPIREPSVLVLGRRGTDADMERLASSAWVMRALEAAGIHPQEVDPSTLALRSARGVDAVVACRPDLLDGAAWQWVSRFVQDGGTLLAMPVPGSSTQAWSTDLSRVLGRDPIVVAQPQEGTFHLAARQPRTALLSLLGAEVDALAEPVTVTRRWPLSGGPEITQVLGFADGSSAMIMVRPRLGRGVVLVLATATELGCSDLPLKPMMVPLLQESVRGGRWIASGSQQALSGERAQLGIAAAGGLLEPSDPSQGVAIEVDGDGVTTRAVPAPGIWTLRHRDGQQRRVAVRLDPRAACIDPVEDRAFDAWRSALAPWEDRPSSATVEGSDPATMPSWVPWVLAVVLGLLTMETVVARRGSPRVSVEAPT